MTNAWDPLDSDMLQRLSTRKWVSMSFERSLGIASDSPMTFLQSGAVVSSNFSKELDMGPEGFKYSLEYINGLDESDAAGEAKIAFEAGMPGAMTKAEVEEQIDLGLWRLKIQGRIVHLEVIARGG